MRIKVIDSHTGGEPTRVVIAGGPNLGSGTVRERLTRFRNEFDHVRSAIINEPRGSDAVVGALLCQPSDPSCDFGVIYFNNVGCLGMCGHGTIGLIATLAHLRQLRTGHVRIETPVGPVSAELHNDGHVTVRNVPSFRLAKDVSVQVDGYTSVTGDVAWGGNLFFLVKNAPPFDLDLQHLEQLTHYTWRIRQALARNGVTGHDGAEIDHIEIFANPLNPRAHSRNFVLCPGRSYDRSPCGTGTSAKMACLYADGVLKENERWVQESVTGSIFEGHVQRINGDIIPFIKGSAFVTAEAELVIDERDPFCWGIPA